MFTSHEVLDIAITAQATGDEGRAFYARMWLDIKLGRPLTREDESNHSMTFDCRGDCTILDDEAKLSMLERELRRGEAIPDTVEKAD